MMPNPNPARVSFEMPQELYKEFRKVALSIDLFRLSDTKLKQIAYQEAIKLFIEKYSGKKVKMIIEEEE